MATVSTIGKLLDQKGHEVLSVAPKTSVMDTLKQMSDKGTGSALVLDGEHLVGIVSERDVIRKVILQKQATLEGPVSEIMSRKIVAVTPDNSVDECMALMTEKRIRHLPVLDKDNHVAGVVSIGDVVKFMVAEKDFIIKNLTLYIAEG
jgi:CBS domain-containing protein